VNEHKLYKRLVRRSSHTSRSFAVSLALILLILGAAYIGTECVLSALGYQPLLVSPDAAIESIDSPTQWLLIGASVGAVLGLIFLILAFAPGRLSRHAVPDERMAVLIDDGVLAGAIAHVTERDARLAAGRVSATVSAKAGRVRVVPTSGILLDTASLTSSATEFVSTLDPHPRLRVSVDVAPSGVVGS
jgi:hypothetical protein